MDNRQGRRAAIYTRISQKDDAVDKVANQEARLRKALEQQGFSVLRVYRDDGISAWKDEVPRPGWKALQADVAADKFDVVAAQNPDRFTRAGTVASLLWLATCAEHGTDWFIEGEGLVSTSDPNADVRAFFAGREAQRESAVKSKRLRERYQSDREAGRHRGGGHRPFGWNRDGTLNVEESALIRWAIDHILAGGSLVAVVKEWNAKRITTPFGNAWNLKSLGVVLRNPRLYGALRHNDEIVGTGTWETICTREEFDTLLGVMDSRSKYFRGAARTQYLLSHIAECGVCGSPMIARSVVSRGVKKSYYQCRARREHAIPGDKRRHPALGVSEADAKAIAALMSIMVDSQVTNEHGAQTQKLRHLHKRMSSIQESLDRLVDAVAEGSLSAKDVAPKRRALENETRQVQDEISRLSAQSAEATLRADAHALLFDRTSLTQTLEVTSAMQQRFKALPIDKQRALIRGHMRIIIESGRGDKRMRVVATTEPRADWWLFAAK